MATFNRNPAFWFIRIGIALVIGGSSYLLSGVPNSKQSTPYWSSWHSWQLTAKPVMKNVTQSLGAIADDFSQINSSKSSTFSPVKFVRDLKTLRSSTAQLKSVAHSPDTLLNIRILGYVTALTNFQDDLKNGTGRNPVSGSVLSKSVDQIVNDAKGVTSEWNREVRQYNSL